MTCSSEAAATPKAIGVDGCRAGWIAAIRLPAGEIAIGVFASLPALLAAYPQAFVAIDIPIGLPVCGARSSDRLARARLGRRRPSVFPAPPRPVLAARSYREACTLHREVDGKAVSAQAWGIFAKIAEVDACMSPALQDHVVEAHPELCFTTMNEGVPPEEGKKTESGRRQRLTLLQRCLSGSAPAVARPRPRGSAADDLLDALAVLWTAERIVRGEAMRLPQEAERDERGLRMEIWY